MPCEAGPRGISGRRRPRRSPGGGKTPVVVVVYHREEETRMMLEQLRRVTDDYSLIVVDNGFEDTSLIKRMRPLHHVRNPENLGAVRSINQGLELAEGRYVAVLHNDLLIRDEGWLRHIIGFMDNREDIGLVGLAGRHTVKADGMYDNETTVIKNEGGFVHTFPTWRFTEVATIDGLGWVMRNSGIRLDEGLGLMHFYDLDLSLQHIARGFRVYVAAVELCHLAEQEGRSTRDGDGYLDTVGGDDAEYFEKVRRLFEAKWSHMLPITRGFMDENYFLERLNVLQRYIDEQGGYIRKLENDIAGKQAEMDKAVGHIRKLEAALAGLKVPRSIHEPVEES